MLLQTNQKTRQIRHFHNKPDCFHKFSLVNWVLFSIRFSVQTWKWSLSKIQQNLEHPKDFRQINSWKRNIRLQSVLVSHCYYGILTNFVGIGEWIFDPRPLTTKRSFTPNEVIVAIAIEVTQFSRQIKVFQSVSAFLLIFGKISKLIIEWSEIFSQVFVFTKGMCRIGRLGRVLGHGWSNLRKLT